MVKPSIYAGLNGFIYPLFKVKRTTILIKLVDKIIILWFNVLVRNEQQNNHFKLSVLLIDLKHS